MKTKNTLEDIIKQSKYYYVNSDITTEHFPKPKSIETENWKIITIDKTMTSAEVLEEIKRQGCRPGNVWELAKWANSHQKEIPKGKWYAALESPWRYSHGDHWVPSVHANSNGDFIFDLGCFEDPWNEYYAFFSFCDPTLDTPKLENNSDSLSSRITEIVPILIINISGKTEELIMKSEVLNLLK